VSFYSQEWLASCPTAEFTQLYLHQTNFGYHPQTHDELYIPNRDRDKGTYVLGKPGSGKSALLQNLIIADMLSGRAVNVLDPHEDLVDNLLHHVPPFHLADTFVLDMRDEQFPFGVNVFDTGPLPNDMARTAAAQRIRHIFDVLWPDVLGQANLPRYLDNAIEVFLANPGRTLVDLYGFLLDDAFRRQLLQSVSDPMVKQFWQLQYDSLQPSTRISKVQPLLARLEQLFSGHSLVRNIIGQRKNSINFRESIEQRRILLIKLPTKQIEQAAQLVGAILVAQIHATLFSFANLPPDKRPVVSLYIDEVQHFATKDIEELFTEGRKFGMQLTIAHQFRDKLNKDLQAATMTAYTKVCFSLTSKDGNEMAHEFPAPEQGVKPEHVDPHPSETLTNHPHLHPPVVQEFIEWYLRPVLLQQIGSHGNKVKISDPGFGLADAAGHVLFNDYKSKTRYIPEVENPLVYLDYLLQQVMVTGLYLAPVLPEAVRGFANCGISFWQKVRWMGDDDRLLSADIPDLRIPGHLVGTLPDGSQYWLREPESSNEQLLHFLFHLRVTMRYLAENPLGTRTTMSNAEVGKMLNGLPPRAAFVRSGKTVGVIYTHDTPPKLPDREYRERVKAITDHTRRTYCRPRADVEQALWGKQATPPPAPSAPQSAKSGVVNAPPHQSSSSAPPPAAPPDISTADTQSLPPLSGWEEAE
jgi:hypothetical protein